MVERRLGRFKSPPDDRDLRVAAYLTAVPEPPVKLNWGAKVRAGQCWVMTK